MLRTAILRTRGAPRQRARPSCLALAQAFGVPAMTAERAWAGLEVGIEIQTIHSRSGQRCGRPASRGRLPSTPDAGKVDHRYAIGEAEQ